MSLKIFVEVKFFTVAFLSALFVYVYKRSPFLEVFGNCRPYAKKVNFSILCQGARRLGQFKSIILFSFGPSTFPQVKIWRLFLYKSCIWASVSMSKAHPVGLPYASATCMRWVIKVEDQVLGAKVWEEREEQTEKVKREP